MWTERTLTDSSSKKIYEQPVDIKYVYHHLWQGNTIQNDNENGIYQKDQKKPMLIGIK